MSVPVWSLSVDWNNDLDFSDTGEDVSARTLPDRGITWERGRDQIRALAPPMAGRFEATLDNRSRDYSPANGASPLAGNLVPGRAVRWQATSGGTIPLWKGNLADLPQEPDLGRRSVRVPALGTLAKLQGTKVSTPLYQDIPTSTAFEHLCAAAGLGASEYAALDAGKTTLTAWWCGEDDAFDMLVRILAAEGPGAAIYERADGAIVFHSRHYRLLTARCATSQATFRDTATGPFFVALDYQPNLRGVVNRCSLETRALAIEAVTQTLATWNNGAPVELLPGQSYTFEFALAAPAQNASLAFGSGGFGWSVDYQSRTSGTHFAITITHTGSMPVIASSVLLVGWPGTSVAQAVAEGVDTSASRAKYGARSLPSTYAPWPYIDPATARSFCNAIVAAYQEPRAAVTLAVPNADATNLAQQLNREISDRVTVVDAQTGLNTAVFVERIRHTLDWGGRRLATEFGCEQIAPGHGDYYIVGTSLVGTGRAGF